MEDQLGSLGLVLNAVVLWTTRYIDAAVAQLRAEGHEILDEDVARLSPLVHENLNVLGRYSFTASTPGAGCGRCGTRTRSDSMRLALEVFQELDLVGEDAGQDSACDCQ